MNLITNKHVELYLTAYYWQDLIIFPDGRASLIDSSIDYFVADDAPIARIQCPGRGAIYRKNIMSDYQWGSNNTYVTSTGRVVGTFTDLVHEICANNDMAHIRKEISKKLN